MGKEFLQEGHLQDSAVSSVKFNDNNNFDVDLHFGCSVQYFEK